MKLSPEELRVLEISVQRWNEFLALDDHRRGSDKEEMAREIHNIQYRVMARIARREHPDIFR